MKIFVYGSLRQGGALSWYLAGSECLGEKETKKEHSLYSLGPFPAMTAEGDTAVIGEVYEVNKETLDMLDRAEGHPNFYVRTPIVLEDGTKVEAYLLPGIPRGCEKVESGDWLDYLTS